MKRYVVLFLSVFLLFGCSKQVKLEGEFVEVIKSDKENNVYSFDFNNTLIISDNGDNYLVADETGNKSIASVENGIISYNDCQIIVDTKGNVLTQSCQVRGKSQSNDYWPKEKVEIYLSNIHDIKYDKYINQYLGAVSDGYDAVPELSALNEKDTKHLDKTIMDKNPFYPFMCFGDFNNDNKYPDIAVIGSNQEGYNIYEDYNSFYFLHAGTEELKYYDFDKIYPFMESLNGETMGNTDKDKDVIRFYNLEDWSGWDIYWENKRYKSRYVNLH
jgi:hypothetical protein